MFSNFGQIDPSTGLPFINGSTSVPSLPGQASNEHAKAIEEWMRHWYEPPKPTADTTLPPEEPKIPTWTWILMGIGIVLLLKR